MKLGIGIFEGVSIEEHLDFAKDAGFDAVFADKSAAADRRKLDLWRDGCDRRGLELETVHCTLEEARGLCIPGAEGEHCLRVLMDNVDNCSIHGVPILVTHASIRNDRPISLDDGCRRYAQLADYAGERGVKIAVENTNSVEFLQRALAALTQENVGFCLDTGHTLCFTPGADFSAFYPRLICCHLHDNHGQRDEHLLPLEGVFDFASHLPAMRRAGYTGPLTLEMPYTPAYAALYSKEAFFRKSYACAVQLRGLFEADS